MQNLFIKHKQSVSAKEGKSPKEDVMITDNKWNPYFDKWMREAAKCPLDFSVIISVDDEEFIGVINWIFGETLIDNLGLYDKISAVKTLDGRNFSW